jgi:hypothetical protein
MSEARQVRDFGFLVAPFILHACSQQGLRT